jgi:hypothetical protein
MRMRMRCERHDPDRVEARARRDLDETAEKAMLATRHLV